MARFVSFKVVASRDDHPITRPPYIVVNVDHVALVEPLATAEHPKCRLHLMLVDLEGANVWYDVEGSLKDVGLRLQEPPPRPTPPGDPLGTHQK